MEPKSGYAVLPRAGTETGTVEAAGPSLGEISKELTDSLTQSGLELEIGVGEDFSLWLVPERTDKDRVEMTYRDLAFLREIMSAIPGARLQAIGCPGLEIQGASGHARHVHEVVVTPELEERLKRLDPRTGVPLDELPAACRAPEKEDWE